MRIVSQILIAAWEKAQRCLSECFNKWEIKAFILNGLEDRVGFLTLNERQELDHKEP